jgi:hypothetical protein
MRAVQPGLIGECFLAETGALAAPPNYFPEFLLQCLRHVLLPCLGVVWPVVHSTWRLLSTDKAMTSSCTHDGGEVD